jgi:hypothetical protein
MYAAGDSSTAMNSCDNVTPTSSRRKQSLKSSVVVYSKLAMKP